jgi:hypothetical protein
MIAIGENVTQTLPLLKKAEPTHVFSQRERALYAGKLGFPTAGTAAPTPSTSMTTHFPRRRESGKVKSATPFVRRHFVPVRKTSASFVH